MLCLSDDGKSNKYRTEQRFPAMDKESPSWYR